MTPEERTLIDQAIDACQRGPVHAAQRIILFPRIVALVTETVAREATYRREHRVELRRRVNRVRDVIWKAKAGVEDTPIGAEHIPELLAAWRELATYLKELEEHL